jgi:predicted  nucleic acid-binding Zn-ribbon protein
MNQPANKDRRLALILLAALLFSIGLNIFQLRTRNNTVESYDMKFDSMIEVRVELERELSALEMELEKYRGISNNLDSLLDDANGKIALQEQKIRKLLASEKDSKKLSEKLKAELESLRSLRDDYLERIDQLITENNVLRTQNEQLNASVIQLSDEKRSLQSKVQTASELKVEYVKIGSFKKKSSGKHTETSLAKRTNKIDVCFTILDNKITPAGDKMVYIVITEPNGKVLGGYSKAEFVDETNNTVMASASSKIYYDGSKQNICLSYENEERILTAGTYAIDVYIDNTLITSTAYMLK